MSDSKQVKKKAVAKEARKLKEDVNSLKKRTDDEDLGKKEQQKLMKIFQRNYPELVENGNIKYPIEDSLIEKMPQLHGSQNIPEKPKPQPMFITGKEFDEIIFIWEFMNNFYEYVQKDTFYIEELYAALKYAHEDQEVRLICEIH